MDQSQRSAPGVGMALRGHWSSSHGVQKGRSTGFDLGCTGIRGPQNVLDAVVFEARFWWPAHLEQGFRLWL